MRFTITHHHEKGWHQILLSDTLTGTSAIIIPAFGAILNSFSIQHDGEQTDVIDGFTDAADFRERMEKGFQSAKLTPYVCRIRDGRYHWQGHDHKLEKFSLDGAAIHGLLYDAAFEVIEEVIHLDYAELELRHTYKGDIPGYPFPFDCYIRYRLQEDNNLLLTTAIHNRSGSLIPVADGWHPYFRIGETINDLMLAFHASAILDYDEQLIPTGTTTPNSRWSVAERIGDTSLDNGYLLDFGQPEPLCTLSDPASGISVTLHPDHSYPYLQIYTPPHRQSIALENLSAPPDAFNNGIGLVVLEPDHTKTFSTRYKIHHR